MNTQLTDLDPDRNGVHYGEQFQFTGQEFEPETGLYNYKARIYDAETGRFLQPDPVHTERAGFDNWDRYQYVWNNPVNFTDPTGMSTNYVHMFNQMMKHAFHGFNHAIKNGIHGNNRIMREIAHHFNGLFPGHKGNGRFSISKKRLHDVGRAFDTTFGKDGLYGALGRLYIGVGQFFKFLADHPLAYVAIGGIVACVFLCAPFLGFAAGVFAGEAVAMSGEILLGGYTFITAGWGAGYLLGGLTRSNTTHLIFDNRLANAGGYLGASLAAASVVGVFGYAGWTNGSSWMAANHPTAMHYLEIGKDVLGYGSMVYDVISGNTVGHLYSMTQIGFREMFPLLEAPFFIWSGSVRALEGIQSGYERRL